MEDVPASPTEFARGQQVRQPRLAANLLQANHAFAHFPLQVRLDGVGPGVFAEGVQMTQGMKQSHIGLYLVLSGVPHVVCDAVLRLPPVLTLHLHDVLQDLLESLLPLQVLHACGAKAQAHTAQVVRVVQEGLRDVQNEAQPEGLGVSQRRNVCSMWHADIVSRTIPVECPNHSAIGDYQMSDQVLLRGTEVEDSAECLRNLLVW
mmetsp:Transcript_98887/g.235869  ORF Transcript_98887/g.235869 Transcript_98887/m.235869 type:complete len:205 (+) Transcript_98887:1181-1795(+)